MDREAGGRRKKQRLGDKKKRGTKRITNEDEESTRDCFSSHASQPSSSSSGGNEKIEFTRRELVEIAQDTAALCASTFLYENAVENVQVYPYQSRLRIEQNNKWHPDFEVRITANDSLDDCWSVLQETHGAKIMCINSASMKRMGGGWQTGSSAQEECYCRRTNLSLALQEANRQCPWPLFGKTKGIYTKNITVFKDANYELLKAPFSVDMLSVFSRPRNHIDDDERQELYSNIFECMAHAARHHSVDTVVFVPVGCGVFGHDPSWVAFELCQFLEHVGLGPSVTKLIVSCYTKEENRNAFASMFS